MTSDEAHERRIQNLMEVHFVEKGASSFLG
jgi:hypothetical protein